MILAPPVPILRSFDEARAKEFYCGFLEFSIDWEHRFEEALPLYMQISKDTCLLHLSEHHGDCCPGGAVRIEVDEIDAFNARLLEKTYGFARPGIEERPYGAREMVVTDPFGNRLIFWQPKD
jgi:uncharacterized glyoxalase superfamily protein PhnB